MPRKKNYLNNRDILTQIHLSKISYCTFMDKEKDCDQDIIVDDLSEINESLLLEGRKERAKRLSRDLPKEEKINYNDISNQEIVIRVMTEEHVPLVPKKKAQDDDSSEFFNEIADDLDIDYRHSSVETDEEDEVLVPKGIELKMKRNKTDTKTYINNSKLMANISETLHLSKGKTNHRNDKAQL